MKELLFALFLFSIKAKSNKEDETKIFYLAPYGVERPGYGGKAEYDWEHPPVDQDCPVRASQPSQAQDQGRQDVDSLKEKLIE